MTNILELYAVGDIFNFQHLHNASIIFFLIPPMVKSIAFSSTLVIHRSRNLVSIFIHSDLTTFQYIYS